MAIVCQMRLNCLHCICHICFLLFAMSLLNRMKTCCSLIRTHLLNVYSSIQFCSRFHFLFYVIRLYDACITLKSHQKPDSLTFLSHFSFILLFLFLFHFFEQSFLKISVCMSLMSKSLLN